LLSKPRELPQRDATIKIGGKIMLTAGVILTAMRCLTMRPQPGARSAGPPSSTQLVRPAPAPS
jgi:hypothetical protein